jgi:hypothetical protein
MYLLAGFGGGFTYFLAGFASSLSTALAARGLNISPLTAIFFTAIGLLFLSLVSAGFGAALGVVFVKTVNRLPLPSTYLKSLGLGFFLYLIISSPSLVFGGSPDIYLLAAVVGSSVVFGFLFTRWTRKKARKSTRARN